MELHWGICPSKGFWKSKEVISLLKAIFPWLFEKNFEVAMVIEEK